MYKTKDKGTRSGMRRTRGMGVVLYSWECRQAFRKMLPNIPVNIAKHSRECHWTFQGISWNILGNVAKIQEIVAKHSGEFPQTFQGMSPNISGNVVKNSRECHQRILGMSVLLKEIKTLSQSNISSCCFCVWRKSKELGGRRKPIFHCVTPVL